MFEAIAPAIPLGEIPTKANLIKEVSQAEDKIADSQISALFEGEMHGVEAAPFPFVRHSQLPQFLQNSRTGTGLDGRPAALRNALAHSSSPGMESRWSLRRRKDGVRCTPEYYPHPVRDVTSGHLR